MSIALRGRRLTASISWVCGQLFSSLFFFDFHRTNFSGFRRTFHQFRSGWLCYFCYSSRRERSGKTGTFCKKPFCTRGGYVEFWRASNGEHFCSEFCADDAEEARFRVQHMVFSVPTATTHSERV